ncbi:MAG: recombinase zinc beta ribbon domain-containing protein [Armatimonadota bacterium]
MYYGEFDWDGQTYQGIHEPLVSRELWKKVQDVLSDNGNHRARQQKHEWAFQGLVSCGHCGCALTAEKKKGRYVYYHCTGHKGCPEKYVREEVLAEQFGEALKAIKLEGDVLEWVVSALKSSHEDEQRYHNEIISSLQRDYARLQHRLDQMYVDKLDGKISQEFHDQKSAEWRKEQSEVHRKMEKHENANYSYMEEGIKILELSNRAWELYEKQEMTEKRRLLDFVFSNSTWACGKLTPNYKKPFDLISEMVVFQKEEEERTGTKFDKTAQNENWLPRVDSNHEPTG